MYSEERESFDRIITISDCSAPSRIRRLNFVRFPLLNSIILPSIIESGLVVGNSLLYFSPKYRIRNSTSNLLITGKSLISLDPFSIIKVAIFLFSAISGSLFSRRCSKKSPYFVSTLTKARSSGNSSIAFLSTHLGASLKNGCLSVISSPV